MMQSFLEKKKKTNKPKPNNQLPKTAQGLRNLDSHRHALLQKPWPLIFPFNRAPLQFDSRAPFRAMRRSIRHQTRSKWGGCAEEGEGKESNLASGEMDCEHTEDVILLRLLSVSLSLSLLLLLKA